MTDDTSIGFDLAAFQQGLTEREQALADAMAREQALVEEALGARAERTRFWEELISRNSRASAIDQVSSYQSMAKSLAGLLGASIRDQAKIMIPFEIAESARDFARFLGSGDPGALAASLQHALAAKRYAEAAKSGGASGGGGHGGGGSAKPPAPEAPSPAAATAADRQTRVIVNVGRQVGLVDTYDFARTLIDAINENLADDVVLEVQT